MTSQPWKNMAMAIALSVAGAGLVSAQPTPAAPAPRATIARWPGEVTPRNGALGGPGVLEQWLRPSKGGTITITFRPEATVLDFKMALAPQLLLPVGQIRLLHAGRDLPDDAVVAEVNPDGEAINLVLRMIGG